MNIFIRVSISVMLLLVFMMAINGVAWLMNLPNDLLFIIGVMLDVLIVAGILYGLWLCWGGSLKKLSELIKKEAGE